jgi:hypothetical protein
VLTKAIRRPSGDLVAGQLLDAPVGQRPVDLGVAVPVAAEDEGRRTLAGLGRHREEGEDAERGDENGWNAVHRACRALPVLGFPAGRADVLDAVLAERDGRAGALHVLCSGSRVLGDVEQRVVRSQKGVVGSGHGFSLSRCGRP